MFTSAPRDKWSVLLKENTIKAVDHPERFDEKKATELIGKYFKGNIILFSLYLISMLLRTVSPFLAYWALKVTQTDAKFM